MRVFITGDIASESGVSRVICEISGPTDDHFTSKDYGKGLLGVCVVLMCQDPRLHLRRRTRLSKKDKTLYMDIVLNLDEMAAATPSRRRKVVLQKIAAEVPETLSNYQLAGFDRASFLADINKWIISLATRKC